MSACEQSLSRFMALWAMSLASCRDKSPWGRNFTVDPSFCVVTTGLGWGRLDLSVRRVLLRKLLKIVTPFLHKPAKTCFLGLRTRLNLPEKFASIYEVFWYKTSHLFQILR